MSFNPSKTSSYATKQYVIDGFTSKPALSTRLLSFPTITSIGDGSRDLKFKTLEIISTTESKSTSTGALIVAGDIRCNGNIHGNIEGDVVTDDLKLTSVVNATDTQTGCLICCGGVSVARDMFGGGGLTVKTDVASDTVHCNSLTCNVYNGPSYGQTACLFFNNSDASTYADHKVLSLNFNNHAESKVETAVDDSKDVLVQQFASDLKDINVTTINDGVFEMSITSSISVGDTSIYFKLYHYTGGSEVLVGTSSLLDISTTPMELYNKLAIAKIAFNGSTDRLIVRIYATKISSGTATITTLFEGQSNIAFLYTPIINLTPNTIPSLSIMNDTQTTTTSSGCLVASGGVAVGKNLYVGGITNTIQAVSSNDTKTINGTYSSFYTPASSYEIGLLNLTDSAGTTYFCGSVHMLSASSCNFFPFATNNILMQVSSGALQIKTVDTNEKSIKWSYLRLA